MKATVATVFAAFLLAFGLPAAAQLESITNKDATAGLRAALEKGAVAAVSVLGKADGFFFGVERLDGNDGTKDFFLVGATIITEIFNNCRFDEITVFTTSGGFYLIATR